ncbi:FAD-binding domain-containing protein [Kribbella antiqua]|uniref:FAD-binding domain-containing protein n=1 Tax=Kribbella antiqua TaxID=2512217 RepID=UPI0018EEBEF6|nr:FAD-binding domain-containing protein [Kribbella antiqua]
MSGWDSVRRGLTRRGAGYPGIPPVLLYRLGEAAALERWREYDLSRYDDERDRPDLESTSRMSIPLKYGEIHPRTMLARKQLTDATDVNSPGATSARTYWPGTRRPPGSRSRPEFERMEYDEPGDAFDAWREGKTGFPFVDAGMRTSASSTRSPRA